MRKVSIHFIIHRSAVRAVRNNLTLKIFGLSL